MGQGLVLLATPLITRLYDPVEIGMVGLCVAFLTVAAVVASLRYDVAIGIADSPAERDQLLLLCCVLTLPVGAICAVTLSGFILAKLFGFGILPQWASLAMFVLAVATGALSAIRFWYVARHDFAGIAGALVRQGIGRAVVPLLAAPLGWGGLLAGEAAGRLLGVGGLLRTAAPALREARRAGFRALRACFVRYRQFPLTFLPSAFIEVTSASLPLPLVASTFGIQLAGQFALAQRMILAPSLLIVASLGDVYQARFIEAARADPDSVRRLLRVHAVRLALLAVAVYAPIALVAWFSFGWVFGAVWQPAGVLAAALCPAAITGVLTNPLSRAMLVSRVPQLKLIADVFRLILPNGGLYVAHRIGWTFEASILTFSLLALLADGVYLAVIWCSVAPKRQRPLAQGAMFRNDEASVS